MAIVPSANFSGNGLEKHDNIQIINSLMPFESTIRFAGPPHYLAPRRHTPPGVAFCFRNTDGKLGCKAVVVVQAIQNGDCYELPLGR